MPLGNIYVLSYNEVRVFDKHGVHLRSMGAQGEGPGETIQATDLSVDDDGEATVFDHQRKFLSFGSDGRITRDDRVPAVLVSGSALGRVVGGKHGAVAEVRSPPVPLDGGRRGQLPVHLVRIHRSANGTLSRAEPLLSLQMTNVRVVDRCDERLSAFRLPIFSQTLAWDARGGRTAAATTSDYSIVIYESDGTQQIIRRTMPRVQATRRLAIQAVSANPTLTNVRSQRCTASPQQLAEDVGWTAVVNWIDKIAITPGNRLAVLRRDRSDVSARRIDIFEPNGEYIGTLPASTPWSPSWRAPDELISIVTDSLGVPTVIVYRLTGTSRSALGASDASGSN